MPDQFPTTAIVLGGRNLGATIRRDLLARSVRVATIARTTGKEAQTMKLISRDELRDKLDDSLSEGAVQGARGQYTGQHVDLVCPAKARFPTRANASQLPVLALWQRR